MESNTTSYTTSNYHILKASIWGLLILVAVVALLIYISVLLKAPMVGVIGWIIICIVPFLFQRRVKRAFSSKVDLLFDSSSVSIREFKSDDSTTEITINWDEIKSYRFQFMRNDVTNLNIIFKSKSTRSFFFIDEKHTNKLPEELSIYSLFIKYIKMYNAGKSDSDKILTKLNIFSAGTPDL